MWEQPEPLRVPVQALEQPAPARKTNFDPRVRLGRAFAQRPSKMRLALHWRET